MSSWPRSSSRADSSGLAAGQHGEAGLLHGEVLEGALRLSCCQAGTAAPRRAGRSDTAASSRRPPPPSGWFMPVVMLMPWPMQWRVGDDQRRAAIRLGRADRADGVQRIGPQRDLAHEHVAVATWRSCPGPSCGRACRRRRTWPPPRGAWPSRPGRPCSSRPRCPAPGCSRRGRRRTRGPARRSRCRRPSRRRRSSRRSGGSGSRPRPAGVLASGSSIVGQPLAQLGHRARCWATISSSVSCLLSSSRRDQLVAQLARPAAAAGRGRTRSAGRRPAASRSRTRRRPRTASSTRPARGRRAFVVVGRAGQVAAVDRRAARGVGDHHPVAEELREQLHVGRLAAAGAGPGELEQRQQQLRALDRVGLDLASGRRRAASGRSPSWPARAPGGRASAPC